MTAQCLAQRRPSVNIWMNKEVEMLKALASKCLNNQRETNHFLYLGSGRKEARGPMHWFLAEPSNHTYAHTHTHCKLEKWFESMGKGIFLPYPSRVLWAGQIIKLTQSRWAGEKKKSNLICMHGGFIEIRPLEWPKQTVFISFFDKEIIFLWRLNKGPCAWDSRPMKEW